jgi:hypothetical protein
MFSFAHHRDSQIEARKTAPVPSTSGCRRGDRQDGPVRVRAAHRCPPPIRSCGRVYPDLPPSWAESADTTALPVRLTSGSRKRRRPRTEGRRARSAGSAAAEKAGGGAAVRRLVALTTRDGRRAGTDDVAQGGRRSRGSSDDERRGRRGGS